METMPVVGKLMRLDFMTSAAVDHALRKQLLYGTETARRYLKQTCVPLAIAERVLTTPDCRRRLTAG